MRYILVNGDFLPGSGMGRPNYELARYLVETKGFETHLVSYTAAPELLAQPLIKWHPVAKPLNSYLLGETLMRRSGRRVAARYAAARVIGNGGNCAWGDVSWVHYVHAAYRPAVATDWLRRTKNALWHRKCLAEERTALQRARLIIANSERTRQEVIELFGVAPERVMTVYLGVDAAEFRPPTDAERRAAQTALGWDSDHLTAVFIGALGDRRKGFDILFAAWQELCREAAWDVDLVAVGAGAERADWQARSVAAGLGARVHFMGFTRQVREVLWASELLVSPTRYEPYGLGVHEALCCGVPAFVTRTAGVAERYPLELQDLLLDAPPTVADVVARLRRWRADVGGYRTRVAEFGAHLRQRSWHDMAQDMITLIERK